MSDEKDAIARRHGKWSQAGVPHKGWYCTDQYDALESTGSYSTCEMCETMQIRFVHRMKHDRFPDELECGCVCSAHMSEDTAGAEKREKSMRNRAQRRSNFPKRKAWKTSARGTPYIVASDYHLMVLKDDRGFFVGVKPQGFPKHRFGKKRYRTEIEARKACFDAIEALDKRRSDPDFFSKFR